MATTKRTTVVGLFHEPERARDAIEELKDEGFSSRDIGILMKDRGEARDMAKETGTHAGEGAVTGAVGGGILGGLAGWLVGIGALTIPGVGPFIAAGALGTALAGAGIGAGVGAIAGALVGMGIPKEEAEWYEGEVRSGRTLVTVKAEERYDDARRILRDNGAYDIQDRDTDLATTGTRRTDEETIRLREERLGARKKREKAGEVGVHKEVVSERKTKEVPVTREEAYVERRRVNEPSDRPVGEKESFRVPVNEERVVPEKETVVSEEVHVGKRPVKDTERVSDTVKKEKARIEKEGDVEIVGGEGYPEHEHTFKEGRCTTCGAQRRRAA